MALTLLLAACGGGEPAGRFSAVGALDAADRFTVYGGGLTQGDSFVPTAEVWRLDLATLAWTALPDLPTPLGRATLAGDWIAGGSTTGWTETDTLWQVNGDSVIATGLTGPGGRHKSMSLLIDGQMWLFGGKSDDQETLIHGDIWRTDGQSWTEVSTHDGPAGMYRHAMAWDADRRLAWLHAGYDGTDTRTDWLWSLDVDTGSWTQHDPVAAPPARASHTLVTHEGKLHAWGGHATDTSLWSFDPEASTWTEYPAALAPLPRDAQVADLAEDGSLWLIGGDPVDEGTPDFVIDVWSLDLASATWTEHIPIRD